MYYCYTQQHDKSYRIIVSGRIQTKESTCGIILFIWHPKIGNLNIQRNILFGWRHD